MVMTGFEKLRLITVCDSCLCASCWQGIVMCDYAQTAGVREMPVESLQRLKLEHSDWWRVIPDSD